MAAEPVGDASEAAAALREIAGEFGADALSRPDTMQSLLADMLPETPRVVRLLVAAAEDQVADTLRQHVARGLDAGTAIKLTSAALAEATMLVPGACAWVTGVYAVALGLVDQHQLAARADQAGQQAGQAPPPFVQAPPPVVQAPPPVVQAPQVVRAPQAQAPPPAAPSSAEARNQLIHAAGVHGWPTGQIVTSLRHRGPVTAMAFSPAGDTIATGGADAAVRLWTAAGVERSRLRHDGEVTTVTFSPDGSRLVTLTPGKAARLWDMTGKELTRFSRPSIWTAVFSPDGKLLASAGEDKAARLWDPVTAGEIAQLAHDSWVRTLSFSPTGARLVTLDFEQHVVLWDPASATKLQRLGSGPASAAKFSQDGSLILTVGTPTRLWDAGTGAEHRWLRRLNASAGAFRPGSTQLAVAAGRMVWLCDASGAELASMAHGQDVTAMWFSPDGGRLVTMSADETSLWDPATGTEPLRLPHPHPPSHLRFRQDGVRLATYGKDGTLTLWDTASGQQLVRAFHAGQCSVSFSPDGRWLAHGGRAGIVLASDSWTGTTRSWMRHDVAVTGLAYSPDGSRLATRSGQTVTLWVS